MQPGDWEARDFNEWRSHLQSLSRDRLIELVLFLVAVLDGVPDPTLEEDFAPRPQQPPQRQLPAQQHRRVRLTPRDVVQQSQRRSPRPSRTQRERRLMDWASRSRSRRRRE